MKFMLWMILSSLPILFISNLYAEPFSFLDISLGLSKNQIISNIQNSEDLILKTDDIYNQLVLNNSYTLVLQGKPKQYRLIENIVIDFFEEKSYQITIFFNKNYISFLTLSQTLEKKYGKASDRNAIKAFWKGSNNNSCILILEAPAIIKILEETEMNKVLMSQQQKIENLKADIPINKQRTRILNEL
ncbi:MAG: hypothetical protein ACRCTQ_03205 [Brevinemataceae bacterium]